MKSNSVKTLIGLIFIGGLAYFTILQLNNLISDTTTSTEADNDSFANELQEDEIDIEAILRKYTIAKTTTNPNGESMTLAERVAEMSHRRKGKIFDQTAVKEALLQKEAWLYSGGPHTDLPLSDYEFNDGRVFLETNPLRIESLMIGDTLPLSIPSLNQTFELVVAEVKTRGDILMWKGSMSEYEHGRFTISRGKSLTAGTVKTPDGIYEFQFFDGKGWIHSSDALFVINEEKSDAVVSDATINAKHEH